MWLSIYDSETVLPSGMLLGAEWQRVDRGLGVITLRIREPPTYDAKEVALAGNPWAPEGIWVHEWTEGGAFVVAVYDRIYVLDRSSLEVRAIVVVDGEEFQTLREPRVTHSEDVLLLASVTRVFCIGRGGFIRWCWSVGAFSLEHWEIGERPVLDGATVRLGLVCVMRVALLALRLSDAAELECVDDEGAPLRDRD